MVTGILLLVLAGLCFVGIGIIISACSAKGVNVSIVQVGQAIVCLLIGLVFLLFQESAECSTATHIASFLLLVIAGAGNYSAFEIMSRAMKIGPNGIIWSLMQSALIFPFLLGVMFFGVPLTLLRGVGVLLIIAGIIALGLSKNAPSVNTQPHSKKWLYITLFGFVVGGITQITINFPSYLEGSEAISSVTRTVYMQIGAIIVFLSMWMPKRPKLNFRGVLKPTIGLSVFYIALFFVLIFKGLNALVEAGVGSIGYPIMIGSCIVGFTVYSLIFLHEKLSILGWAGLTACFLGIISISL